jgi:hypothetical protein
MKMKNAKLFSYLLIIISTSFFISCTRENVDYPATTKEVITNSSWSIDYYFAGQDKTAQFNNYKINFTGNGTVTAENGINSFTGNWSMITDVYRKNVLSINISEAHLQDLNSQWTVEDVTTTGSLVMKNSGSEMRLRRL